MVHPLSHFTFVGLHLEITSSAAVVNEFTVCEVEFVSLKIQNVMNIFVEYYTLCMSALPLKVHNLQVRSSRNVFLCTNFFLLQLANQLTQVNCSWSFQFLRNLLYLTPTNVLTLKGSPQRLAVADHQVHACILVYTSSICHSLGNTVSI